MTNLAAGKLDDRIAWPGSHLKDYLHMLDEADAEDEADALTREVVEGKIAEAEERLARYRGYLAELEASGESQASLTDPDARLTRGKQGFVVAHDPQTVVDSATHPVDDYVTADSPTDHGRLAPTLSGVAGEAGGVLEAAADKGYDRPEDIVACLENGILPHVICPDGEDAHDPGIPYEEADGTDPSSTEAAEISRCPRAGVVPEAYARAIEGMEVVEVRRRVVDEKPRPAESAYDTPEETGPARGRATSCATPAATSSSTRTASGCARRASGRAAPSDTRTESPAGAAHTRTGA